MDTDPTVSTDNTTPPPAQKGEVGSRALSATIAAALGAVVGFFIGTWGDSRHRKVAQSIFAALGAVFGGLLSYFATKQQDVPSHEMTGAPEVLRVVDEQPGTKVKAGPVTSVEAATVEMDGPLQQETARAASR